MPAPAAEVWHVVAIEYSGSDVSDAPDGQTHATAGTVEWNPHDADAWRRWQVLGPRWIAACSFRPEGPGQSPVRGKEQLMSRNSIPCLGLVAAAAMIADTPALATGTITRAVLQHTAAVASGDLARGTEGASRIVDDMVVRPGSQQ